MHVLIFGSSYVANYHRARVVKLWAETLTKLNRNESGVEFSFLLVDSASPMSVRELVPTRFDVIHQPNNIGHPNWGGDGWGRDLCTGLQHAIDNKFDYAIFVESDFIFAQAFMLSIAKMVGAAACVLAPWNCEYNWIETGLMLFAMDWVQYTNFICRYNWPTHQPGQWCERKCEAAFGDDFFALPLRGMRNDQGKLRRDNFNEVFPFGAQWLSHCDDFELYNMLLQKNGVTL